jgi:hypothetical protein
MRKQIMLALAAAALLGLLLPREVGAYGAARVGYTHVGPTGAYHTSDTVARGPGGGVYATDRTTATGYRGTEYRGGYEAERGGAYGVERGGAYGTDYRYVPSYGGAAYGGAVHYGYVR